MSTTDALRVLFIEDSPEDVELEERQLRKGGLKIETFRVETAEAIVKSMSAFKPHLVISDYSLPTMDGLRALRTVRELSKDVPFLFCSGTIGEERAIESLRNGATDYVVKGSLNSLVVKVQRALQEAADREQHKRLEEQFRQAQKMDAIGRFAGGIAHDFNNLLTVINGYTELMITQLPVEHLLRAHAEEVLAAGERAASLTRQLLAFSRKQVVAPMVLSLNTVVKNTEKLLRRLLGETVEYRSLPASGLGNVLADAGQMEQVLMNLVVNARDAMPHGGKLTVETQDVVLDEAYTADHSEVVPGPYVMLAVTDTGTGMTREVQSHLFEPFFTTKEPGKGTGLGLSTVFGIVRQSGGHLWVYSELGRGTTFKVYLPKVAEPATSFAGGAKGLAPLRGTETVLVAEDSESVRKLMVAALRQQGYQVIEAVDGAEALRKSGEHPGEVQLLVTDMVLPGMTGPEIAAAVSAQRPGIKVLYASGYTEHGVIENGGLEVGKPFLQKPFTPEALSRKVRELLDRPASSS